jgi:dienelactone hydrolase
MSCCPADSWPALKVASTYAAKGTESTGAGETPVRLYTVGAEHKDNALVIITDIFGIDSGRHKAIADTFAEQGFCVVLVDATLGAPVAEDANVGAVLGDWAKAHNWTNVLKPVFANAVIPHLASLGHAKFATLGFCWGVWVQFHALADGDVGKHIVAQICPHPSLQIEGFFGGKGESLAANVNVPTLLLPAKGDPAFVKQGGDVALNLASRNVVVDVHEFQQQHGWVVRGDVSVEAVRDDVSKALDLAIAFAKKHAGETAK